MESTAASTVATKGQVHVRSTHEAHAEHRQGGSEGWSWKEKAKAEPYQAAATSTQSTQVETEHGSQTR